MPLSPEKRIKYSSGTSEERSRRTLGCDVARLSASASTTDRHLHVWQRLVGGQAQPKASLCPLQTTPANVSTPCERAEVAAISPPRQPVARLTWYSAHIASTVTLPRPCHASKALQTKSRRSSDRCISNGLLQIEGLRISMSGTLGGRSLPSAKQHVTEPSLRATSLTEGATPSSAEESEDWNLIDGTEEASEVVAVHVP